MTCSPTLQFSTCGKERCVTIVVFRVATDITSFVMHRNGVFGDDAICSVCEAAETLMPVSQGLDMDAWGLVGSLLASLYLKCHDSFIDLLLSQSQWVKSH